MRPGHHPILQVSSPTGTLHLLMAPAADVDSPPGDVENEYPDVSGEPLHVVPLREPVDRSEGLARLARAGHVLREAAVLGADGSHLAAAVAVHGLSDAEAVAVARGEGHDVVYALTPETFCVVSADGGRVEGPISSFRDAASRALQQALETL